MMRLLGQSQLVDGTAYRHLGYVAATQMLSGLGIITSGILAVAAIMALRRTGVRRGDRVAKAGVLFVLCVVVVTLSVGGWIKSQKDGARRTTSMNSIRAMSAVRQYLETSPSIPPDLSVIPGLEEVMTDGYGNRMRIGLPRNGEQSGRVISAGPDGAFDTTDDLVADIALDTAPGKSQ